MALGDFRSTCVRGAVASLRGIGSSFGWSQKDHAILLDDVGRNRK
jgi:hypothetical protein